MQPIRRLPKVDFEQAWKQVPWKKILIGDINRINVFKLADLGIDIFFCGIGAAFALLIAYAAFALPNEARTVVWMGCAFLLYSVVNRPSWGLGLGLPLMLLVVVVGSVTLSAVAVGFSRETVFYLSLQNGLLPGVAMSFGVVMALFFMETLVYVIARGFGYDRTDEEVAELRAIRKLLRERFGIRFWWIADIKRSGDFVLVPFRSAQLPQDLPAVGQVLSREVAYTKNGKGLIIHPLTSSGDFDAQPPALS